MTYAINICILEKKNESGYEHSLKSSDIICISKMATVLTEDHRRHEEESIVVVCCVS